MTTKESTFIPVQDWVEKTVSDADRLIVVSNKFREEVLREIKKWRDKFGGPEVMQSHNIYEGRDIIISNINDINSLKNVIKVSYEHGLKKLMILSDDTPPYKFGEGYILTDENDKEKFEHFEAANTYLMNELVKWFDNEKMDIES